MKKRKWAMLAGFAALMPLSEVFSQTVARPPVPPVVSTRMPTTVFTPNKAPATTSSLPWQDQGVPSRNARVLLGYLQKADSHGVNPDTYKASEIAAFINSPGIQPADRSRFDVLMSEAFAAYVRDMTGPRIASSIVTSFPDYWRKSMAPEEFMSKYILAAADIDRVLKDLPPKAPVYVALQAELARLRELPADSVEAPGQQTVAQKIAQVLVNMDRQRASVDRPSRYIEVNIAAQTFTAVDSGKTVLESRAVVGETKPEYETQEQRSVISGIRFNPTWYVPENLVVSRIAPHLKDDPHYYDNKGLVFSQGGKKIDPATIDWKKATPEQLRRIKVNQLPGKDNSLGYLRTLMDSRYDQYLHYTNAPELFGKGDRFFSSGCMRVEQAIPMAAFILGVSEDEIKKRIKPGKEVEVRTKSPVSFFGVYNTVTLDADGKLQYHPDAYGLDARILDELKKKNAVPPALNVAAPRTKSPPVAPAAKAKAKPPAPRPEI